MLCELMFISASRSRYPLNTRNGIRAVDRNSDLLIDEYAKKAREVNWEYGGTPMPPLQPRGTPAPPRVKEWCFGACWDASQYVASARLEIADNEADNFVPPKVDSSSTGRPGWQHQKESLHHSRQARLLLDRLQFPGTRCGGHWAVRAEAAVVKERRAQCESLSQSISVMCRGFGLLD